MSDRVLKKVQEASDDQTAYEAQQQLKSIYHRLRSRQKLEEAYELLSKGCISHIANGQMTCAGELGRLLVDAYSRDQCLPDNEHAARVLKILNDLEQKQPALSSAAKVQAASEGSQIAKGALKWAKQQGDNADLVRQIHNRAAKLQADSGALPALAAASAHYARGDDSTAFASALASAAQRAPHCERDLFAARAILQVLAAARDQELQERTAYARAVLEHFDRKVNDPENPQSPLMHFLDGLLKAASSRSAALLQLLEREYRPSLFRDGELLAMLEVVKQKHFGMQRAGLGGLLGSLFQNLGSDPAIASA